MLRSIQQQVRYATDASGNVTGLVGAGGSSFALAKPRTAVLIGDSITNRNFDNPLSTQIWFQDTGYFTWANILLGWGLKLVNEAGVSGETSTQILARFDTAVIDYSPGVVFVMAGSNDAASSVSATTVISNLSKMYAKVRGINAALVCFTIMPRTDVTLAAERRSLTEVNAWIRDYARNNPDTYLIDSHALFVEPSTGDPRTGYTSDGIHPSGIGASVIGREIYRVLANTFPRLYDANLDNFDYYNLVYNSAAVGNNAASAQGWSPGTGVTGNGPDGWQAARTGTASGVSSKVARAATDLRGGDWAQMAVTGAGTADTVYYNLRYDKSTWGAAAGVVKGYSRYPTTPNGYRYVCTTGGTTGGSEPTWPTAYGETVTDNTAVWTCVEDYAVGERVYAQCEFETDSFSGAAQIDMEVICANDAFATLLTVRACHAQSGTATYVPPSGVLRTPPFAIPTGTTRIHVRPIVRCGAGVTGNFRVSGVELNKTTDALLT